MDNLVYLNLGCGNKLFPRPFINVDIREECEVDIADDVVRLENFESKSVDLIYASHLLEHLNFAARDIALVNWHRVLKAGGRLRIAVPDFEAIAAHYFYWKDLNFLQGFIHGGQKNSYDTHYISYDFESLKTLLEDNGFVGVERYDFSQTWPHIYIDDFSQCFAPDYAKKLTLSTGKEIDLGGKLMSLNVQAVKA